MIYRALYKCRLCGEIDDSLVTDNEILVVLTMATLCVGGSLPQSCGNSNVIQAPTLYSIHICKDGNHGFSDFVGYRTDVGDKNE